ncbi:hypothetical protein [Streptomyces humi]
MSQELSTREQFDAFAEAVAQKLGTHCRTEPLPQYGAGLSRLIIDGDGRALWLCQPDDRQPSKLRIKAALPDDSEVECPSVGVTAITADHVARAITRRLYPLHAEAAERASQLAARRRAEADGRRAVTEAIVSALPGAHVDEMHRHTRIVWEHASMPPGQQRAAPVDSVCVDVGPSGAWVTAEIKASRPDTVVPSLTAFAQASRG